MVERRLAKAEVAGSSPVSRSRMSIRQGIVPWVLNFYIPPNALRIGLRQADAYNTYKEIIA